MRDDADVEAGRRELENATGMDGQGTEIAASTPPSQTNQDEEESPPALSQYATSYSTHISLRDVDRIDIQVRKLAVTVDLAPSALSVNKYLWRKRRKGGSEAPRTKQILHSVSATMPAGTLTAILGGSGSGKTTMLNVMAQRMASGRLSLGGNTLFNGMEGVHSVRSAYVMQQDVLLPMLTVRETLRYSADLRLPRPTTQEERRKVVEDVILELGLKECADTRIGNHQHKGCSGGEKRRTSIGVQLLSNPSVLFLDEPTTGLDATSAFQLVRTLKALAKKGRTIVTTIHQPRSEIWGMLDGLVILTRGSPVFAGAVGDCVPWFQKLGMQLPPFVNPAEFLIDIAAIDNRSPELEAASSERVERLKVAWLEESQQRCAPKEEKEAVMARPPAQHHASLARSPFIRQTRVLTSRIFLTTYRDPMGMLGSLSEAILMGILTGWVFFGLSRDQSGIRSRQGALYNAAALQGYLILMFETYRLTVDIELFDREHNENVVDVVPFLLSRRLARFLTEDLPVPLAYSITFYWMAGFRAEADTFLIFFSIIFVGQYIAVTYAAACVAAARDFATASLIANLGYTVQSMACGYFIQSNSIPIYVRWLKWTAYVFYAFGSLCANEFVGQFYDCPLPGGESDPACAQYTGSFIMDSLGFPQDWVVKPIVAMVAFVVMFYTAAFTGFEFLRVEMSIAQAHMSDTDLSAGKEMMAARSNAELRTVDIGLDRFALDLDEWNFLGRRLPTKTILHPVTATFQAGLLNIIMGPSGSGKTSLLNAMALRLHNGVGTRYKQFGEMRFNGSVPSDSVVRSVCSYVCQDDDALLPSLTVRETLRFSAGLRLPSFMTTAQKIQRAEDILLKLGLKDCADNLIGSEKIKGISGGEKRRVSIAVQILTDPQVLLLDEPTSGLDAFTASSIIQMLQALAQEGRTLILTIHQSRSDMFQKFGNVLLLTRGGSPVYSGKSAGLLPHFNSLGYPCPTTTNPADFALDLITVDLQHSDREAVTRRKVRSLISSWTTGDFASVVRPTILSTPAQLGSLVRQSTPFAAAYPILVRRAFLNFRRQPDLLIARTTQVTGLAVILTLFFAPLHNDYAAVQTRLGFIQEFCAFNFVGMLQNVAVYPSEKSVFYRENDDGTYGIEAFLAQYITLEVPFEILTSLIFAVLVDLAAGLPRTPQLFFVCFFNCFCIVSCGESLGIMFNTLFPHTGFAISLTNVFLSISQFMSGVMSINMPSFLQGVNYLSPLRYAIRNLAPYSLHGITFTCNASQRLPNGQCPIDTGEQVLQLYKLDTDPLINLIALGVCTVLYRLLAYVLLKGMRTHWGSMGLVKRMKRVVGSSKAG